MNTRILIADDHPLVRSGLKRVLDRQPDLTVVAEAGDGAEALERLLSEDIDLAIVDVAMPRLTGLQLADELQRRGSGVRVLILSMYDNDQYYFAALRAGAAGYVLKSLADTEVVEACRAVARGKKFVYPAQASARVRDHLERARRGEDVRGDILTPRELEVLKLVAEGNSSQKIAQLLVISIKTVERHRANIIEKLGVRDRVGLTRYAIRRGLVEP